jgi:hypothetical protein
MRRGRSKGAPKRKAPAAAATEAGANAKLERCGAQLNRYAGRPATAIGPFDAEMPVPLTVYVAGGVIYQIDAHLNVTVYRRVSCRGALA